MTSRADSLLRRLENPPFGTETSERLLMKEAAAEIERLRADLASECERRDEIIASTTKLWKDAESALAEAREVILHLKIVIRSALSSKEQLKEFEEAWTEGMAGRWLEKYK